MKALYIAIGIAIFYFLALPPLLGWYFAPEKIQCELNKPCKL